MNMKYSSLFDKCNAFEKLSGDGNKRVQDANIMKRVNLVLNQISRNYLPTAQTAKSIFDEIQKANVNQPTINGRQYKKDLEKFKIHLEWFNQNGTIYRKAERDACLNNINVLLEGKDFNQYHQLVERVSTTPIDELDRPTIELDEKPDLGF